MSVTRSHKLSIGLVGLPNAGKSTLFNAITKNSVVAENYPFATIEKNVGVVNMPDERLDALAKFFNSAKVVPSAITFIDIAGLVKGASKGEGLGNQFLANIREVDVILFVVRAFESEKIVHVYERVNPQADVDILLSELALKDIESVEKRLAEVPKKYRGQADEIAAREAFFKRAIEWLGEGKPIIEMEKTEDEQRYIDDLFLLTDKKMLFLLNTRAGISDGASAQVETFKKAHEGQVIEMDVKMLDEMKDLEGEELAEYLEMLGVNSGETPNDAAGIQFIPDLLHQVYRLLDLITFYTGSEKESNAWSIVKGATVHQAAGVIHTDLMETFVTAEVVNVEDMIKLGGLVQAREAGVVRAHGKDYIVQDGDYVIINATA